MSRRERRSADQWKALIAEYDQSDETMKSFCKRRQLALSTFSRWCSFIRAGERHSPEPSAFKQVVASAVPANDQSAVATMPAGTQIVLNIGDQITLRVHTSDTQ